MINMPDNVIKWSLLSGIALTIAFWVFVAYKIVIPLYSLIMGFLTEV